MNTLKYVNSTIAQSPVRLKGRGHYHENVYTQVQVAAILGIPHVIVRIMLEAGRFTECPFNGAKAIYYDAQQFSHAKDAWNQALKQHGQ